MVMRLNMLGRTTYIPAFLYVLVMTSFPNMLYFNPALVGSVILLFSLTYVLSALNRQRPYPEIFNSALIVSVGSLFYQPLITFLPVFWAGMGFLNLYQLRTFLVSIIGFALPYVYLYTYFYLTGGWSTYVSKYWQSTFGWMEITVFNLYSHWLVIAWFTISLVLSFTGFSTFRISLKVIHQKLIRYFALVLFWVVAAGIFYENFRVEHIQMSVFPLSIFFSFYGLNIRRAWWGDLWILILLASVILLQLEFYLG
jgi:hypothetical protein